MMWFECLALHRAADPRIVGRGVEEYQRVVGATAKLFGAIAVLSMLTGVGIARGYLAIALPVGLIGCLAGRYHRRTLVRGWEAGESVCRVLVLGSRESAVDTVRSFTRYKSCGFVVVGVCMPDRTDRGAEVIAVGESEIPILGDHAGVLKAIESCKAEGWWGRTMLSPIMWSGIACSG